MAKKNLVTLICLILIVSCNINSTKEKEQTQKEEGPELKADSVTTKTEANSTTSLIGKWSINGVPVAYQVISEFKEDSTFEMIYHGTDINYNGIFRSIDNNHIGLLYTKTKGQEINSKKKEIVIEYEFENGQLVFKNTVNENGVVKDETFTRLN